MLIVKDKLKYNVTKGAYEAIYKPLGYKPILDKTNKNTLEEDKESKESDKEGKESDKEKGKQNNFNNKTED